MLTLQEILRAVLTGTHVLVALEGEHEWGGKVACVPLPVFEVWKAAFKRNEGTGEWPSDIGGTVRAYISDDAILPVTRTLLTFGDDSGIVDGDEDYRV